MFQNSQENTCARVSFIKTRGLTHLPLDRQGEHMWPIVRQLPMKAGWWDAPLAFRDLAEATHNILQNLQNLLSRHFSSLQPFTPHSKDKKDFNRFWRTSPQVIFSSQRRFTLLQIPHSPLPHFPQPIPP